MGDREIKIEKTLDISEAAAVLRLLADELEGKTSPELQATGIQLHDFNKMKVRLIKQEGGHLALTLKMKNKPVKAPAPAVEFTDIAARDYRPFKRAIKATFTELNDCAAKGTLPPSELLSRFMAESKQLIAFPGFGDPCYHDYWQACLALEQAVKDGSATVFQEKLAAIAALKKDCHRRFK